MGGDIDIGSRQLRICEKRNPLPTPDCLYTRPGLLLRVCMMGYAIRTPSSHGNDEEYANVIMAVCRL